MWLQGREAKGREPHPGGEERQFQAGRSRQVGQSQGKGPAEGPTLKTEPWARSRARSRRLHVLISETCHAVLEIIANALDEQILSKT
jgi:hypothetical protein